MGRVNFGAKKSRRHSERSEESPGRKRKRQEVRGVRSEIGGEKWQNGGDRYALSENSTVNRILFLPLIHRKRSPPFSNNVK